LTSACRKAKNPVANQKDFCIAATNDVVNRRHKSPAPRQGQARTVKGPKMKTHAQAVVIGGGVIGCSILYHLTKLGWSDVVLLERDELTSGSTWHAAANIHGLHDSANISRLQHYTMNLYK
jgi:hypothetical protein